MSSTSDAPVPVPRTGVPLGITDPVEKARAELKAALAAIEEKGNIPRRVSRATERKVAEARRFSHRNPAVAAALVVAGAAAIGAIVWAGVRAYTR
jgi:ferric-dicitrate binding protein FerR (iron transport regulator)